MTFQKGDLAKASKARRAVLSDYNEGQRVECAVKKVEDYGVFLEIKGTKVSGLCHKSEVSLQVVAQRVITYVASSRTTQQRLLRSYSRVTKRAILSKLSSFPSIWIRVAYRLDSSLLTLRPPKMRKWNPMQIRRRSKILKCRT